MTGTPPPNYGQQQPGPGHYPSQQWGPPQPGQPQPWQVPPGYEIKRKKPFYKRVWFWLLIIVLIIVIIVVAAVASAVNDATSNPHKVVYHVTGTGRATISYYESNGTGNTNSKTRDQSLPWTRSITIKGDFSGFDVQAQSTTPMKRTRLACAITVDGKVVSRDSASGMVATVLCDGTGYGG